MGSTRRQGCIPEFLLFRGVRLVGGCEFQTQTPQMASPYSPMNLAQKLGSPSTIGILQGGIRSPYNKLEAQPTKGLRAPKHHEPSRFQRPKSKKLTNFHFHEYSWREQTDAQKQRQEHKKCSSPSLPNPTKSN